MEPGFSLTDGSFSFQRLLNSASVQQSCGLGALPLSKHSSVLNRVPCPASFFRRPFLFLCSLPRSSFPGVFVESSMSQQEQHTAPIGDGRLRHIRGPKVVTVVRWVVKADKSVVVDVARSHRSRVGVRGRSFSENCVLAAGCHPQGSVVGERWGTPPQFPPHKPKLRGLLGVHTLWRGWVGKSLRTQLYSRNVLIRGSTSTHSPGHSVSYTHDVFLRASSGAHAHLHEAFVLLVTPLILNYKSSQSSSTWHPHIARVLVCVDALFLKTARLPRGVTGKVRSLEKGGGLSHNSPLINLNSEDSSESTLFGVGGWAKV